MPSRTSPRTAQEPTHLQSRRSRRRRYLEACAFVAVWVTAGYLLPVSSNGYLLLGIPLTIAFQLVVRRRPLRELFAVGTDRFRLDRRGVLLAVALAAVPAWYAARSLAAHDWVTTGWYLAATAGAACAAFAIRSGSVRSGLQSAVLPIAVGAGGMTVVYGVAHVLSGAPLPVAEALSITGVSVMRYGAPHLRDASNDPALELAPFPLGQATPDAEPLVVLERVLEALAAHVTTGAHLLGLAGRAALLGEERLGIGLGAQRALLPPRDRVVGRGTEERKHRRDSDGALVVRREGAVCVEQIPHVGTSSSPWNGKTH